MVTADPPTGGWLVDGSVTMSITVEDYRRRCRRPCGAAAPARCPRRSTCGLEDHGRPDPVRLGGLVHRQQPVALVDQPPGAVTGHAEGHPVEGKAAGHV